MADEPSIDTGASVQLCADCEKITLKDDSPEFEVAYDEHGEPSAVFPGPTTIRNDASRRDIFPELPFLLESSRKGCTFCKFLRETMSSDQAFEALGRQARQSHLVFPIPISYELRFAWGVNNLFGPHFLIVEAFCQDSTIFSLYCTVQAMEGSQDLADWLGLHKPTRDSYTSKETVDWMRSVLENCSESHDCSSSALELGYLPERLLDIQGDVPKIVLRDDISSFCRTTTNYTALSYCWGPKEDASYQRKVKRDSIEQFRVGIDQQGLSAVQQDAIWVTKALSIPYIWIDSLCILQDDIADWERQCEQMDRIYGCAYVTLLAGASSSCRKSFLQRPSRSHTLLPFRSAIQPSLKGFLSIDMVKGASDPNSRSFLFDLEKDTELSCLSTRGWAYQENILSTRKLVFGEYNLHYLCPSSHATREQFSIPGPYGKSISTIKSYLSRGHYYEAWRSVIPGATRFMARSFAYPKDILPALAGLARIIQKSSQDEYLAGHWAQDLYRSLPWVSKLSMGRSKEWHYQNMCGFGTYIIPSWSVLCRGEADFMALDEVRIDEASSEMQSCVGKVTLAGSNPLGSIKHAFLRVSSHCFQQHQQQHFDTGNLPSIQYFPQQEGSTHSCCVVMEWQSQSFASFVVLDYCLQDSELMGDTQTWRWLLIGSVHHPRPHQRRERPGEDKRRPYGLLLRAALSGQEWYRIGIFRPPVWYGESGPDKVQSLSLSDFKKMCTIETVTII